MVYTHVAEPIVPPALALLVKLPICTSAAATVGVLMAFVTKNVGVHAHVYGQADGGT